MAVLTTASFTAEIVSAAGSPGQTSNAGLVALNVPDVTVSAVCSLATAVAVNDEIPPANATTWEPVSSAPYVGEAPVGEADKPLIVAEPPNVDRRFPAPSTASTSTAKPTPARKPAVGGVQVVVRSGLTKRNEQVPLVGIARE
jgi:hypothetical protein